MSKEHSPDKKSGQVPRMLSKEERSSIPFDKQAEHYGMSERDYFGMEWSAFTKEGPSHEEWYIRKFTKLGRALK